MMRESEKSEERRDDRGAIHDVEDSRQTHSMVRPEGLEPPTLGSEDVKSAVETDSDQGGQMDMFSL